MRYQYIPAVILDWAGTPSVRAGGCETLGAAGMDSRLRSPMRSGSSPNSCRAWRRYSPNSARPFQACAKPWTHGEPPGCARLHHGLYTGAAARGDSSGGPPRLRSGRQRDSGRSGRGRPKPFMCYRNAILLGAYPLWRCVKIGDTASDIAEGINAGMWTVGITATGNEIGLSRGDWEALPRDSRATLEREAARRLTELADLCRDGLFLNAQRWLALTVGAEEGQEDRRDTKRSILHIH